MKIKNLNVNLEWRTIRDIPEFFNVNLEFPSYNIQVSSDQYIISNIENIKNYSEIIEKEVKLLPGAKKLKFFSEVSKNQTKSNFYFDFSQNYSKYLEIFNKLGFFKKINFNIDYDSDGKGDFEIQGEYEEIDDINKNNLFMKCYRSSDYLNIKFLINKNYFIEKEIYSFLIFSKISNNDFNNKQLRNIFTDDISSKWLDVNEVTALLTIPFIESDLAEISDSVELEIIPLNKLQSDMYNFISDKHSQNEIIQFYNDFFSNQLLNIGKIYKQAVNNETVIFYQNYLYLFNKDSFDSNCFKSNLDINQVNFNNYYPLLNKDSGSKTINLSYTSLYTQPIENKYKITSDYLGYYDKDLSNYIDIALDLNYFHKNNIISASIKNIEELNNYCNIYLEFITSFYNNENFYVESNNSLKYLEKYKIEINNISYIAFLFKYTYSIENLNSTLAELNINKNQIIFNKDLINFSAKIIL